ncbi:roadblock/LC7 domain-containing protein [Methanobacterium formicicum]|uniref:roadblock/LC7 domain-containing protein n=1 Tax=Methanobacterium formicicum TaxID=2162 RepID=UPI002FE2F9F4
MTDTHLKMQLEKATVDLDKTTDVEGILVVANDGRILHHNLRVDVDINLFSPMSQVISSSSLRLLNSSGQGDMERVLVESSGGKILFLGVENGHLIILMRNSANVGMVLVNAKRASLKINETTHDLTLEVPTPEKIPEELPDQEIPVENVPVEKGTEEIPVKEVSVVEGVPPSSESSEDITPEQAPVESTVEKETPGESLTATTVEIEETSQTGQVTEPLEKTEETPSEIPSESTLPAEIAELPEKPPVESEVPVGKTEDKTSEIEQKSILERTEEITTESLEVSETESTELSVEEKTVPETGKELEPKVKEEVTGIKTEVETEVEEPESVEEVKEAEPTIPTVKPPISFPSLPKQVEIPDDPEKRADLILEIYEYIFLAMSLGAAKIMGVAPARGLTKKFLPFDKCKRLLENVDLKSNATIDFAQIKENAREIPIEEREKIFIQDFNRIIEVITENYGKVMGYEAFRAMVRPEFMEIKNSYGEAMDKLDIKGKMHPEIAHLFS